MANPSLSRRDRRVILGVMAALAGLMVVLAILPSREDQYTEANERVLAELPTHPEAVEVSRRAFEFDGGGLDTGGWMTEVSYRVPDEVTAEDVLARYRDRAGAGWVTDTHADGSQYPVLAICRDTTRVTVLADNLERLSTYQVQVDHDYGPGGGCALEQ